jgi:hypothetical protein
MILSLRMSKETKFGYGFLLAGVGLPYLIDKLLGPSAALIAAVVCTLGGLALLVAGHLHRESTAPRTTGRGGILLTLLLVGAAVTALGWAIVRHISATSALESAKSPVPSISPISNATPTATPSLPLPHFNRPKLHAKPMTTPSPEPTASPILAATPMIVVRSATPTPLPTPLQEEPLRPCFGDNLKACGDRELLEWGKPLLDKVKRISDQYDLEVKIAGQYQFIKAMDAAGKSAADDFRECCAADALNYYNAVSTRVPAGNSKQSTIEWMNSLLQPIHSKAWKQAREDGGFTLRHANLELNLLTIDLQLKVNLKKLQRQ